MAKGLVSKTTGKWYKVRTDDGSVVDCQLRGNFRIKGIKSTNPIAVGDTVEFELQSTDGTGLITAVDERRNCIIRRSTKLSKQTHIIAANLDQACLVATIGFPRTSTGFIDRFLVTAEAYHVPCLLVFNKIDLYDDELQDYQDSLFEVYRKAGYTCIGVSATKGTNLDQLKTLLEGKTSLFAGHSGVGKSALLNALSPDLGLKVGDVSLWSMKGKHTTTFAELFPYGDGFIIDTPGIKEFGMVNFSKEEVSHFFPEMKAVLHDCRFANCTHEHEPGCAVKEAVEQGVISDFRYENYLNILHGEEMDVEEWQK
ncbi:MAG: ribosome small subunit-dependent GTPase A [Bacteroidales bacterium]|nr:ribosome small subunit-dependent GTPase A [Bacteroidales bacterium]